MLSISYLTLANLQIAQQVKVKRNLCKDKLLSSLQSNAGSTEIVVAGIYTEDLAKLLLLKALVLLDCVRFFERIFAVSVDGSS